MNYVDMKTDDFTQRTYTYQRQYVLKDGTIKTCEIKNKRVYKPNCTKRVRLKFTDEQKIIIIEKYEKNKNYSQTAREINENYDFTITPHFVKKIYLDRFNN